MIKQNGPKISVIVPIYNVEKYLHQCIDCIISQTYENLEIILVNDGSTDKSGSICDNYSTKDDRIKVIHKSNGGSADARNVGTAAASGVFIMYLDSDDWMDLDTCWNALKIAIEKSADIVFWSRRKEFQNGKGKNVIIFNKEIEFTGDKLRWLHRRMVGLIGNELSNPTKTDILNAAYGKLYKRSLISEFGIHFIDTQEIGSEDVLFNIEVFHKASVVIYLNMYSIHYRTYNPNALTKNHKSTLYPRFLNLFSRIEKVIETNDLGIEYKIALNNRIALSIINCSLAITSKRNLDTWLEQVKSIDSILNDSSYCVAINELKIRHLPLLWKFYFFMCKARFSFGVYLASIVMHKLK